jgi:hypothetical protein
LEENDQERMINKINHDYFDKKVIPITSVNMTELNFFIAINLFMGIVVVPEIKIYWEKETNVYGSSFVQSLMTYSRYTEINSSPSLSSIEKLDSKEKRIFINLPKRSLII